MIGHLSTADVANAQRELRGLMDDIQALQETPEITIKRGGTTILAVVPRSIRLDNQQADNGIANGPAGTVDQTGKVKIATEHYTAEVRVGDRFAWQGQPCMVTTAPMARAITGMTVFAFSLTATNRG